MPPGAVVLSRKRNTERRTSEGPPPDFLEDMAIGARLALDDVPFVQQSRRDAAYHEMTQRLKERGVTKAPNGSSFSNWRQYMPVAGIFADRYDGDRIYQAILADRQKALQRGEKDPWADLPDTREDFETAVARRERDVNFGLVDTRGSSRSRDQALASRSDNPIPAFIGGLGAQALDPVNLGTAPIGFGARSIIGATLSNGVINALIETGQQPLVAGQRARMGEELTVEEAALNIGAAAVFGGVLGGGGKLLSDNWAAIKAAPADVQERAWAAILDRTPGLRKRVGSKVDWDALNPRLADIAESVIAPERMTDAERGAIAALRRQAGLEQANPFVPNGAGTRAHYALFDDAMQGIINDSPAYVPKIGEVPGTRLRFDGDTALASGLVRPPSGGGSSGPFDLQAYMAKVKQAESGGNATIRNQDPEARMLGSTAQGFYQFTNDSWLLAYRSFAGRTGESDAAILKKRLDPAMQEKVMAHFTTNHAVPFVRRAGAPVTDANVYMVHFLGPEAKPFLQATNSTPVESILKPLTVKSNRKVLAGKTVGEVKAWAAKKMGGDARPANSGSGAAEFGGTSARRIRFGNGVAVAETSPFGMRKHPILGRRKMHNGIDYSAPSGTDIFPAEGGVVTRNFFDKGGGGWVISVKHADGTESSYMHMARQSPLTLGRVVSTDTVIGAVGTTGRSTGPHLHFAVASKPRNEGGKWINPATWLKGDGREVTNAGAARSGDAMADQQAEANAIEALDREIADTDARLAQLDSELDADAGSVRGALEGEEPEPSALPDAEPLARPEGDSAPDLRADAETEPQGQVEIAGLTSEARAIMPDLRRVVEQERGVSLNRLEPLSTRLGTDQRNIEAALQQMAIDGLVLRSANGNFRRLPQRKQGPEDLFSFIAARGGLADTEGHDLATIFEVERTVRWKRRPDSEGRGGVPLKQPYRTTRPALVPGIGPIVRRETGLSVDAMGEQLWEAGFFGTPDLVPRPTERQVIDLIEDAWSQGRKVYSQFDQAEAFERSQAAEIASLDNPFRSDFDSEEHFLYEWSQFDNAARDLFGATLDEEMFGDAWRIYREAGDGNIGQAVLTAIQREIDDVRARELAERGLTDAEEILDEWEAALRADGLLGAEEIPAGRFDPADPGPDDPLGWAPFREESGPIEPEQWRGWDDPDGPTAQMTADSMEHDLRVREERSPLDRGEVDDPAIAERQREEARLRAEAPLRGENATGQAQDGTMGMGLFDAADQPQFRLDEEGDPRSMRDLLDEFEEDETFIRNIKDCL